VKFLRSYRFHQPVALQSHPFPQELRVAVFQLQIARAAAPASLDPDRNPHLSANLKQIQPGGLVPGFHLALELVSRGRQLVVPAPLRAVGRLPVIAGPPFVITRKRSVCSCRQGTWLLRARHPVRMLLPAPCSRLHETSASDQPCAAPLSAP